MTTRRPPAPRRGRRLALALALALAAAPQPLCAEELDAQIQEIRSLVRERRYPLALESLRLLARHLQDLRLGDVAPAFPAPPPGWSAGAPLSLLEDDEIWGRRVEARSAYRRDDGAARADVTVDIHSPFVPVVALSLNPLFLAGDPLARPVEVGGERGLLRFVPDTGEGELRVVIGREILVTIAGRGIDSGEPLLDLARRVDFPLLRARAGL